MALFSRINCGIVEYTWQQSEIQRLVSKSSCCKPPFILNTQHSLQAFLLLVRYYHRSALLWMSEGKTEKKKGRKNESSWETLIKEKRSQILSFIFPLHPHSTQHLRPEKRRWRNRGEEDRNTVHTFLRRYGIIVYQQKIRAYYSTYNRERETNRYWCISIRIKEWIGEEYSFFYNTGAVSCSAVRQRSQIFVLGTRELGERNRGKVKGSVCLTV